ncbi:hypothetical protein CTEN210_11942 [Chaetoceros tenuissimus]|uniref:Fe2OG dioxygenase domain-containing protein n=1 Tax=Chaetoceros tenuissimus TaxID=426638 RepID=A0AAD3D0A2_9STRA|nr:hypothetical protein CTEN210_11942 [Chaetoceros tenuissimus]
MTTALTLDNDSEWLKPFDLESMKIPLIRFTKAEYAKRGLDSFGRIPEEELIKEQKEAEERQRKYNEENKEKIQQEKEERKRQEIEKEKREQKQKMWVKSFQNTLDSIQGDFCTGIDVTDRVPYCSPQFTINGMNNEIVVFPLLDSQAKKIKSLATRQLTPNKNVSILHCGDVKFLNNEKWQNTVQDIVMDCASDIGIPESFYKNSARNNLKAVFSHLTLYEAAGSHETDIHHFHYGNSIKGSFATLFIQLPSVYTGGEETFLHPETRLHRKTNCGVNSHQKVYASALYDGCDHLITPLQSGWKLCLIYTIIVHSNQYQNIPLPNIVNLPRQVGTVKQLIEKYWTDLFPKNPHVYFLDHAVEPSPSKESCYPKVLKFQNLQHKDKSIVQFLQSMTNERGEPLLDVFLAVISAKEDANPFYSDNDDYSYNDKPEWREWNDYQSYWIGPKDEIISTKDFDLDLRWSDSLLPVEAEKDGSCFLETLFESYGDHSNGYDDKHARYYHRAAVVFWPKCLASSILRTKFAANLFQGYERYSYGKDEEDLMRVISLGNSHMINAALKYHSNRGLANVSFTNTMSKVVLQYHSTISKEAVTKLIQTTLSRPLGMKEYKWKYVSIVLGFLRSIQNLSSLDLYNEVKKSIIIGLQESKYVSIKDLKEDHIFSLVIIAYQVDKVILFSWSCKKIIEEKTDILSSLLEFLCRFKSEESFLDHACIREFATARLQQLEQSSLEEDDSLKAKYEMEKEILTATFENRDSMKRMPKRRKHEI